MRHRWLRFAGAILSFLAWGAATAAPPEPIFENGFEPLSVIAATVENVQKGEVSGTVILSARIVTARSADARHLWIADSADANMWQGVYVFRGVGATVLPQDIAIGTRVDVTGTVEEFDIGMPPTGNTLTELSGATVVLITPAEALTPLDFSGVVPLNSINDGEPYEGVLVRVANVRVTGTAAGNLVTVVDNTDNALVLDDEAFAYSPPPVDTCYSSVTGVMHLSVQADERRLLPRTLADLVVGSGCN